MDRIHLMNLFRRDMSGIDPTTITHDDNPYPAFKNHPETFKYEYHTHLFKVWCAGREAGSVDEAVKVDAQRYRRLRQCHWADSQLCVVWHPLKAVTPGHYCPSGKDLDKLVDELPGESA